MVNLRPLKRPGNVPLADSIVIIGLGRFGQSLALELMNDGADVLAIDRDEDLVQQFNGRITHAVLADATREDVLRQLGIHEATHAVVAIGDSVEASLLTSSLLIGFGIPHVWAKAVSDAHGRILEQIGVHHVVHPERESGVRVAHQVRAQLKDYIDLGGGYALVRTTAPAAVLGKPLREVHVRSEFGVTVIASKRADGRWVDVSGDSVLSAEDEILVTGPIEKAERFHLT
ncbi:TrkA family potassium uptake protein [Tessaracoccus sp. MC1865]|uniref:potassium channel family protein n=1 Tax=Tessaracoccus sp. MC1865 TaxID=2760310 RepID=UPI001AE9F860|nr:TrkA family potassium uptake protein [Tessaracoccus sp. MC1865]QTO37183.1 TrkA family potassium uptake protein [Tessaracoccus sp. MC1865]